MIKKILNRIFNKPKIEVNEQITQSISTFESLYSEPREEVLAGGFVYHYPLCSNGVWYFSMNIPRAVQYSWELDGETRGQIMSQVMEREINFSHASTQEKYRIEFEKKQN